MPFEGDSESTLHQTPIPQAGKVTMTLKQNQVNKYNYVSSLGL